MKQTILGRMVVLTLIAVVISSVVSVVVVYGLHLDNIGAELIEDGDFIVDLLNETYTLEGFVASEAIQNSSTRITVVAPDGIVIYDNQANPATMENHGNRAEIIAALEQGEAQSRRLSNTLGIHTFYYAVLLEDGNVMRFAKETDSFLFTLYRMLSMILMIIVGVILIALWLGDKMANAIITPINNLDLDDPLGNDVYEELAPLLTKINRQNKAIKTQMLALEKQKERFETITTNMSEGLMLLDHYARIVYMNSSAFQILGEPGDVLSAFIGKGLLTFNRDLKLRQAVEEGLKGNIGETMLTIDENHYELLVSPVSDEGESAHGVIIIVVNVTQRYEVEKMRKEFSANVSHELRTPLTAISTYAELLKNNMVDPKDVTDFSTRIFEEARRMSSLVDDILKLSRLDEKVEINPKEDVNLHVLAKDVAQSLRPLAEMRKVSLEVTGEPATVFGDAGILFEMIYNLCDNGIKYNRQVGGKVAIDTKKAGDKVIMQIVDNGIGIPKDHHDRIFERFYRVDKSHSRKTGGTGLGLSIVKHAAAYHNAVIRLESTESVGTKVIIEFQSK